VVQSDSVSIDNVVTYIVIVVVKEASYYKGIQAQNEIISIIPETHQGRTRQTMKNIVALIRPHQYFKNLFIILPLFFAGQIDSPGLLLKAFLACAAFCLTASSIYILNDLMDINEDRLHPRKKTRPLAAGTISPHTAKALMAVFFLAGVIFMAFLAQSSLLILGVYVTLNISYSYYLKHIAIVDISIIATGFVLRLFIGAVVTGVELSKWIVIMTFLLALFLALAKRRDDILIFLDSGKKMRKALDGYNLKFIDGAMIIMASVVIVAYILYTVSQDVIQRLHSDYLYITALFVVIGIMRYMQIVFVEQDAGSPTKILLGDRFIQLTILVWMIFFAWILYG